MLHCKHLASPAKSCLHLVRNEEDPVLLTDLLDSWQEIWRRRDIPALPEDRLNQDCGCVLRGALLAQQLLKLGDAVV